MASRDTVVIDGFYFDETLLGGTFAPNGSSAPTIVSKDPSQFTVAHTATGRFTVSFLNGAGVPLSLGPVTGAFATLALATPAQLMVTVSSVNVAAGTIEIDVTNPATGALTNIAAATGNQISFVLRLGGMGQS